jgi:hypothetical protein
MSYSEFFDVSLGVKQGEPLSPLLFIMFINDIGEHLSSTNLCTNDVDMLSILMLMFADDIAIFSTDPHSLQHQLNCINEYSKKWGLKVNVGKTKVCIFQKYKYRNIHTWELNGDNIEIVDVFTYLGVKFFYNGSLKRAVESLNEQALKAYNHLISIFSRIKLDIKTKLLLFDSMVAPIITYGCEVWGIYDLAEVDKLHLKFCKQILGVRQQTSNAAVLGELGRFPLSVICKERALNYWCKIMRSQNTLINRVFNTLTSDDACMNIDRKMCWPNAVKTTLDDLGYSNVWLHQYHEIDYICMLKQRVRDVYIQTWFECIQSQSKLKYYIIFKKEFCFETYLNCIDNEKHRIALSRFRLCSHHLEIERGRLNNIDINDRKCKVCTSDMIESEFHFLCICPIYRELRLKYNIRLSFNTLKYFETIMSTKSVKRIRKVSKFIYFAMLKRKEIIDSSVAS